MNPLQKRILALPNELQDLIGSFNVEHRIMMRRVCAEIQWVECANLCGTTLCRVDAITSERSKNTIYYCSCWCRTQDEDDYKDYYKRCNRPTWK